MLDMFTLSNGLRVVAEKLPHFRSVSVGLWVKAGSMDETPGRRAACRISSSICSLRAPNAAAPGRSREEMDAVGGQINRVYEQGMHLLLCAR